MKPDPNQAFVTLKCVWEVKWEMPAGPTRPTKKACVERKGGKKPVAKKSEEVESSIEVMVPDSESD